MWVWSDELAERFPAMRAPETVSLPLVAYAIEGEMDLEMLARDVLSRSSHERLEVTPLRCSKPVAGR